MGSFVLEFIVHFKSSSLPMLKIEKVQILFGKILMQSNPLCGFWSKKVFFFFLAKLYVVTSMFSQSS